ncbi:hypothetical protein NH340_JMT08781 [Sarcoptes scabiei]|nr:hypothetical protein NH340_JMT08781 [Sarcoptes scabiei]
MAKLSSNTTIIISNISTPTINYGPFLCPSHNDNDISLPFSNLDSSNTIYLLFGPRLEYKANIEDFCPLSNDPKIQTNRIDLDRSDFFGTDDDDEKSGTVNRISIENNRFGSKSPTTIAMNGHHHHSSQSPSQSSPFSFLCPHIMSSSIDKTIKIVNNHRCQQTKSDAKMNLESNYCCLLDDDVGDGDNNFDLDDCIESQRTNLNDGSDEKVKLNKKIESNLKTKKAIVDDRDRIREIGSKTKSIDMDSNSSGSKSNLSKELKQQQQQQQQHSHHRHNIIGLFNDNERTSISDIDVTVSCDKRIEQKSFVTNYDDDDDDDDCDDMLRKLSTVSNSYRKFLLSLRHHLNYHRKRESRNDSYHHHLHHSCHPSSDACRQTSMRALNDLKSSENDSFGDGDDDDDDAIVSDVDFVANLSRLNSFEWNAIKNGTIKAKTTTKEEEQQQQPLSNKETMMMEENFDGSKSSSLPSSTKRLNNHKISPIRRRDESLKRVDDDDDDGPDGMNFFSPTIDFNEIQVDSDSSEKIHSIKANNNDVDDGGVGNDVIFIVNGDGEDFQAKHHRFGIVEEIPPKNIDNRNDHDRYDSIERRINLVEREDLTDLSHLDRRNVSDFDLDDAQARNVRLELRRKLLNYPQKQSANKLDGIFSCENSFNQKIKSKKQSDSIAMMRIAEEQEDKCGDDDFFEEETNQMDADDDSKRSSSSLLLSQTSKTNIQTKTINKNNSQTDCNEKIFSRKSQTIIDVDVGDLDPSITMTNLISHNDRRFQDLHQHHHHHRHQHYRNKQIRLREKMDFEATLKYQQQQRSDRIRNVSAINIERIVPLSRSSEAIRSASSILLMKNFPLNDPIELFHQVPMDESLKTKEHLDRCFDSNELDRDRKEQFEEFDQKFRINKSSPISIPKPSPKSNEELFGFFGAYHQDVLDHHRNPFEQQHKTRKISPGHKSFYERSKSTLNENTDNNCDDDFHINQTLFFSNSYDEFNQEIAELMDRNRNDSIDSNQIESNVGTFDEKISTISSTKSIGTTSKTRIKSSNTIGFDSSSSPTKSLIKKNVNDQDVISGHSSDGLDNETITMTTKNINRIDSNCNNNYDNNNHTDTRSSINGSNNDQRIIDNNGRCAPITELLILIDSSPTLSTFLEHNELNKKSRLFSSLSPNNSTNRYPIDREVNSKSTRQNILIKNQIDRFDLNSHHDDRDDDDDEGAFENEYDDDEKIQFENDPTYSMPFHCDGLDQDQSMESDPTSNRMIETETNINDYHHRSIGSQRIVAKHKRLFDETNGTDLGGFQHQNHNENHWKTELNIHNYDRDQTKRFTNNYHQTSSKNDSIEKFENRNKFAKLYLNDPERKMMMNVKNRTELIHQQPSISNRLKNQWFVFFLFFLVLLFQCHLDFFSVLFSNSFISSKRIGQDFDQGLQNNRNDCYRSNVSRATNATNKNFILKPSYQSAFLPVPSSSSSSSSITTTRSNHFFNTTLPQQHCL